MRRREFITFIGVSVAWPFAAVAQEAGRTYRLGVMTGVARAAPRMVAFFDELKLLGFIEGQNLKIVINGFDLRDDQYAEVAAALAKAAPHVVFSVGSIATRAAQKSAHAIPIVALSGDLVAGGFVHSLAHPGGNITGVGNYVLGLDGKRQEILMDAVPGAQRIAVLADPTFTPAVELQELQNAARARSIEVPIFTATAVDQIAPAIAKAKASGANALNVLTAALFSFNRHLVIEHVTAQGLPAIYEYPEMAEEGGLIGYGPRLTLIYRQIARVVAKVLSGAKPEDLPVEQPTKFELVINLKTAKAMGVKLPEALLARADKVIE
jgi:putative tryptophan/tyrosine transport system substrate-binding protein